jgi:sigma-B regulation protein RsbU (phosphoserine phosphatase)
MAIAITTLRTAAREQDGAAAALTRTNALLCRDNEASMFATLFYGVLDLRTGRLDYANCGHNAPLVVSPDGIRELPTTGIPVGLIRGRNPSAGEVILSPDDTLVLYTDGVTEALSPQMEEFGTDRLKTLASTERETEPPMLVERIFAEVDGFAAGQEQYDDITCLVARVRPRP